MFIAIGISQDDCAVYVNENEKIGELINYNLIVKKVLKLIFPSSAKNILFVYVAYPSAQPAVHLTSVLVRDISFGSTSRK